MKSSPFLSAYRECAAWASTDEDGNNLDEPGEELAPETLKTMRSECAEFLWSARRTLHLALSVQGYGPAQAGHDFWLTRNRHGAGFWDRGLPIGLGHRLTDFAHTAGSRDLYRGDDGLIYQQ